MVIGYEDVVEEVLKRRGRYINENAGWWHYATHSVRIMQNLIRTNQGKYKNVQ